MADQGGSAIGRPSDAERFAAGEEHFRTLVENAHDLIQSVDTEGRFVFVNHSWLRTLGYTADEVPWLTIFDVLHPRCVQHCLEVFKQVLAGEEADHVEATFVSRDGRLIEVEGNIGVRTAGGRVVSTQGFFRDVTERKSAERALLENERYLAAVLNSIGAGVMIIDATTHLILTVNDHAARLAGRDKAELVGKECHRLVCPKERGACPITDIGETVNASERVLVRADGRPLPIMKTVSVLTHRGERHLIETFVDLSEIKRLEGQLRQAQKMEAIGTLAGGVAHDFNNILSAIFGYADLARTRAETDPKLAGYLDQVLKAAQRARELTRQILTFSRKGELQRAPLGLAPLVKETVRLLRSAIPATIEIRQDVACDGVVFADATQIQQALMNLCTNAYQAMRERGGVLSVVLREQDIGPSGTLPRVELPPGRYALLEVSDTGVGMDAATIEKIFEPYFTTKRQGEGTGLGLAVVDGVVKSHQGAVSVYSEPGRGSTFRIYLPLLAAAPAQQTPRPEPPRGGSERIFFVEDEAPIRELAAELLDAHGYRVRTFASAAEALAAVEAGPREVDLVVTDMSMPGMNGRDFALRVLALRPDLPVILCSGYSEIVSEADARRAGIRSYVQKPLAPADLLREVRAVLDAPAAGASPS